MKNNRGGNESTKKIEDLAPPPTGVAPGAMPKGSVEPDQTRRKPKTPYHNVVRVDRAPCPSLGGKPHRLVTREIPWKDGTFLETYCTGCRRTSVRLDSELNDKWRKPKDVGEA